MRGRGPDGRPCGGPPRPADAVVEAAREAAPRGARVSVSREGDRFRVVVVAEPPVLRGLPFEVREEAVASVERAAGGGP